MRLFTVTRSDLLTRSFTSLGTEVFTDLDEARASFLDGTPFGTWEALVGFAERLNRWEPGDTWGQHLTDADRAACPGLLEGSPAEVRVTEGGAFWHDGALDGVSLSLEVHEV